MQVTKVINMREFDSTLRAYYNLQDVRIIDVHLYNKDVRELYHTHNEVTEILFVLEGTIQVRIKDGKDIKERTVITGNIVTFEPGELHHVMGDNARVIVFKYVKTKNDVLETFIHDWKGV